MAVSSLRLRPMKRIRLSNILWSFWAKSVDVGYRLLASISFFLTASKNVAAWLHVSLFFLCLLKIHQDCWWWVSVPFAHPKDPRYLSLLWLLKDRLLDLMAISALQMERIGSNVRHFPGKDQLILKYLRFWLSLSAFDLFPKIPPSSCHGCLCPRVLFKWPWEFLCFFWLLKSFVASPDVWGALCLKLRFWPRSVHVEISDPDFILQNEYMGVFCFQTLWACVNVLRICGQNHSISRYRISTLFSPTPWLLIAFKMEGIEIRLFYAWEPFISKIQ